MVFVYRGAGSRRQKQQTVRNEDDSVEAVPPEQEICRKKACMIQKCLARSNSNQARCTHEIAVGSSIVYGTLIRGSRPVSDATQDIDDNSRACLARCGDDINFI